jgi:predicted nucleic acid-binding protein
VRYVLDCSVAVRWFVRQSFWESALHVLDLVQRGEAELVAPRVIVPELGHVLRKLIVGEKLSVEQGLRALDLFFDVPLELVESRDLTHQALELAVAHSATFYDALYVTLAIREDLSVLTADGRMARAFTNLNRTLHLAEFPVR